MFRLFVCSFLLIGLAGCAGQSVSLTDPVHSVDGCHKQAFPQCSDHGGQ